MNSKSNTDRLSEKYGFSTAEANTFLKIQKESTNARITVFNLGNTDPSQYPAMFNGVPVPIIREALKAYCAAHKPTLKSNIGTYCDVKGAIKILQENNISPNLLEPYLTPLKTAFDAEKITYKEKQNTNETKFKNQLHMGDILISTIDNVFMEDTGKIILKYAKNKYTILKFCHIHEDIDRKILNISIRRINHNEVNTEATDITKMCSDYTIHSCTYHYITNTEKTDEIIALMQKLRTYTLQFGHTVYDYEHTNHFVAMGDPLPTDDIRRNNNYLFEYVTQLRITSYPTGFVFNRPPPPPPPPPEEPKPSPRPKSEPLNPKIVQWCKLLGIANNDHKDLNKIKAAYRLKALKYHPDRNPAPQSTAIFQAIQQAYEGLCVIALAATKN